MTSSSGTRVLLVDDEPFIRHVYAQMLTHHGNTVVTAEDGRSAVEILARESFDVIVSDISMPRLDGIELMRRVRAHDLDVPVILITGAPSVETAAMAIEQGVMRYLPKPVRMDDLCTAVRKAHRLHEMARLKRQALELMGRTDRQLGDRASLDAKMGLALEGLNVLFQPIVSWSRREVIAYEALLRSSEPTLSTADALLGAADRLGIATELGRRVRRLVARELASTPSPPQVFLNVQSGDLRDDELFDAAAPLSPFAGQVVLEVTERVTLESVPDVRERVTRLRALGYRIAVDDLGAGYAGLASLAQLEPDIVKLDMSISRGIDGEPTKQVLARGMAALCGEMGVEFVVEGVETVAELDTLAGLGADLFQGYLFARPARGFPAVPWATLELAAAASRRRTA